MIVHIMAEYRRKNISVSMHIGEGDLTVQLFEIIVEKGHEGLSARLGRPLSA
jgi:hypothetical protein